MANAITNAPALLVAGVGLSFLGLELVTSALQESTSRTVRGLVKRSTRSLPACALVGVAAGALVQSASSVVTVLGSTTSAGMTTLRQAIPIVAFANVGPTALVFAGSLDIRAIVLIAVGVSGIGFSISREFHWKAISAIALGVALLLYGSDLMGTAASDVQGAGWFASFLGAWRYSATMAFTLGAVGAFLTQSTTAVGLMTVALANAGLVEGAPALAMIYGANLGSTPMRMVLTRRSSGAPLQVSRFQDLFKIAGVALFLAWFIAEQTFGVPGMYRGMQLLPTSLAVALASANLAFNGSMAIAAALLVGPLERLILRRWPPDLGADLAAPLYAVPEALADAATATDLLEREQVRILQGTREYIAIVRVSGAATDRTAAAALHRRFTRLFHEIEHFHIALVSKQMDALTSARVENIQSRQKVVELLEDSLYQLTLALEQRWRGSDLEPLVENLIETLDFLLLFTCEAAGALDAERAEFLLTLSADRSDMMAGIRSLYLGADRSLTETQRALLLRLTALFERSVWMVQRYAELLGRSLASSSPETTRGATEAESDATA